MKPYFASLCLAGTALLSPSTDAAVIYVTTSNGGIWQYDSVADMATQTSTTSSGTLVNTIAAYGSDLDSTMDLTNGKVYRITGAGDVVEYADLTGFLNNTGATILVSALYTGNYTLNGFSYDGINGGFYGTLPNTGNAADDGDVRSWTTIANVLTNTGTNAAASYGGNLFNFYDPDATATTAANSSGIYTVGQAINTQYYQSSSTGRLEGYVTKPLYASNSNNRGELTGTNVFGGTTTAFGTGVVARAAFAIPEPSTAILGGISLLALRRRRR